MIGHYSMRQKVTTRQTGICGLIVTTILLAASASAQDATPARQGNGGGGVPREKSYPKIVSGKWTGPRTADGQPDISGHWSNTISNHSNFTDPGAGAPGDRPANRPLGPRSERAPSRVTDPADGQVPFQPWAAEKVKEFQAHFANPTRDDYIEPLARCAPAGVPKSFYWHGYEIAQYPGYVVLFFSSGTRIIHLDNTPHLPASISLWNGDSRGHWEGNTLVVDVTNVNGKALFGRTGEFAGPNARYAERYIFQNDGKRFNYEVTITDPEVYTRPFTVTVPARKYTVADQPDGWNFETRVVERPGKSPVLDRDERICTENNGGFGGVSVVGKY